MVLIVCHIAVDDTRAQSSTFKIATPPFIDTLDIRPVSVAFGDVNGDTLTDIVMYERRKRPVVMLYNPAISNFDSANTHFLNFTNNNNHAITLLNTDPENRNREEIYFLNWNRGNRAFLWNTSQTPGFFEETHPVPAVNQQANVRHTSIGDINNDGLPDMIIDRATGGFPVNRLIMNVLSLGNQPAQSISSEITVPIENSLSSILADFNKDGFLDYYVMNDSGTQDRLFVGSENGFTEKLNSLLKSPSFSFSAAMGDFNNDNLVDLYRTNPREAETINNLMFRNNGDLNFRDVEAGFATLDRLNTRNAVFGDFDNDGDQDLLSVEFSTANSNTALVANTLYENLGDGNYAKRTQEPVMNKLGNWNSATFLDFDQDGDLDIIAFGSQSSNPIVFFENTGNSNSWLSFRLEQTNGLHPEPHGAQLTLDAVINGDTVSQFQEYNRLQGFQIQHPAAMHFGLGNATEAKLKIRWPSGQITSQRFSQPELNQRWFIKEPLAGRLAAFDLNNNVTLETVIGQAVTERFRLVNIGNTAVEIENIQSTSEILRVENFTPVIAKNDTGYIDITFNPFDNTQLGRSTDTLMVQSDAVNPNFSVIVESNALTLKAPFTLQDGANNPLLGNTDNFGKSYWADFDNQNGIDALVLRLGDTPQLFQNQGGLAFSPIENAIAASETSFSSAAIGDIDNNGTLDLFIGNNGGANKLFLNNGNMQFEDLAASGIAGIQRSTVDVSLVDINRDSFLDLIITNTSSQQNEVLIQRSPDQFEAIQAGDFTTDTRNARAHLLTDFNKDGLIDIFVFSANTPSEQPVIYYQQTENIQFIKTPVNNLTTLDSEISDGMAFDFENDGDNDLLLLGGKPEAPLFILLNNGDNTVSRFQSDAISSLSGTFSGATSLDINLDGFIDLFLTNSVFTETNELLESIRGQDFLRFTNGEIVTEREMSSQGTISTDIDGNGREDIFVTNQIDRNRLYLDDLADTQNANWVAIEPRAITNFGTEALVPGTHITVSATINNREIVQTRILAQNATKSQSLSAGFFGLGDAQAATARITFPDSSQIDLSIDEVNRFYRVSTEAVSTDTEDAPTLPQTIQLNPNFPNPFNPSTTISFTLPSAAEVTLEIYSILGRKVATLIDRRMAAGNHRINFNARQLPSGVYISVLRAGEVQRIQKMTLIK